MSIHLSVCYLHIYPHICLPVYLSLLCYSASKLDPNLHADSTDKELPKVDDEASDDKEDEDIDADTLLDNNEDPLADKDEDPSADGDDYSP